MNNNRVITVTAMHVTPGAERSVIPLSSIIYAFPNPSEPEHTIIHMLGENTLIVEEDIHTIEGFMRGELDR